MVALNCLFQKDRGKTASTARILSPNQTRRPLPCLLIKSFFYGWWILIFLKVFSCSSQVQTAHPFVTESVFSRADAAKQLNLLHPNFLFCTSLTNNIFLLITFFIAAKNGHKSCSNTLLFSQNGLDFPLPRELNLDVGKTRTMENSSYLIIIY